MSSDQTTSGIANIELEAERILKEARDRAGQILLKANEEAAGIASSGLALEEAKAVSIAIIEEAKEEAERKVEEAKVKASEIRAAVDRKMPGIVSHLVDEITGV